MSIDSAFSPVNFPTLRDAAHERAEAESRNHGYATGYSSGLRSAAEELVVRSSELEAQYAEKMRAGQEQVDYAVSLLAAAAQAINDRAIPLQEQAQDTLIASALDLAEAILGYELRDGQNAARSALARVMGHVDPAQVVTVRMNPSDLVVMDRATLDGANVELMADPSLGRGDAIADFAEGYLDARIGSALGRARAALLGETI